MLKMVGLLAAAAFTLTAVEARGQAQQGSQQVVVESYYKLRWGSGGEWKRLYNKNEAPVLAELQRKGLIASFTAEQPFTHMAGDQRWDFRVRITYRDADAAVVAGGAYDKAEAEAIKRLFPNSKEREEEERRRGAIIEEHWDVIVMPHGS